MVEGAGIAGPALGGVTPDSGSGENEAAVVEISFCRLLPVRRRRDGSRDIVRTGPRATV